jgi:hypothetical protein
MPGLAKDFDLVSLCRETGWPVRERQGGKMLLVDLETPGEFYQARIEVQADRVQIRTELPACEAVPPPCQEALGRLLLTLNACVRLARATTVEKPAGIAVQFEVVLSQPCAVELAHAFASLSMACRLCAREAMLLQQDAALARAYMAAWLT